MSLLVLQKWLKGFQNLAIPATRLLNLDRVFHRLDPQFDLHGGDLVAKTLKAHNVSQVFTLTGGHISPILTACQTEGIRVIDTRHEASAAFAADATSRLTGVPGVCVVTAGPGLTNTVTAVKNAQMAESAMLVIGGAAPSLLKGRGALQDVEQLSIFKSLCKATIRVGRVRDLQTKVKEAISIAGSGVPGPVLLELPIDLLYPYNLIKEISGIKGKPKGVIERYVVMSMDAVFAGAKLQDILPAMEQRLRPRPHVLKQLGEMIQSAQKPLLVVGSQAMLPGGSEAADKLAANIGRLGIPAYLGGMSRGLLGPDHALFFRQARKAALKEADLVILAGSVCDFRLEYGKSLTKKGKVVIINRGKKQLNLNRGIFWKAALQVEGDVIETLSDSAIVPNKASGEWVEELRRRENEEESKMMAGSGAELEGGVNPVLLFEVLDSILSEEDILIGDGGDFVGTASRILRPRRPLSWLDPGAYGTLGVGGGFALGVKAARPHSTVWVLWGDGSSSYSIAEIEPSVRHNLPFIGIIGNDGAWGQITRDQVGMLGSDVGSTLDKSTPYHKVGEGYGAVGLCVEEGASPDQIRGVLLKAKEENRNGKSVVINVILGKSKFRAGSISV